EAPEPGWNDETEGKKEGKDAPSLITREKEDEIFKENNSVAYGDKEVEPRKETTEEYYECKKSDLPNLDTLYSIELLKWSEPIVGIEFSDDDSDWNNNLPCGAKIWLGVVFIMKEDKEVEETEELENLLSESVIRVLNEYRSRAPHRGPLTSPFPDLTEKILHRRIRERVEKTGDKGSEYPNKETTGPSTPN
ncbi:21262_t:CDS:2, partial [Gigaspora margarita]